MDLLLALFTKLGNGLWVFMSFLIVIAVVVVIHELGHFWVARWCGVKVTQFSIGFGKGEIGFGRELLHFHDKHGTRWSLQSVPLGGFVKFADDQNAASKPDPKAAEGLSPEERAQLFQFKPLWQKASVIAAGPIANFILSLGLFSSIFYFSGERVLPPKVAGFTDVSAGRDAGLQVGDVIKTVDGRAVGSFRDVLSSVDSKAGQELRFGVDRSGSLTEIKITPRSIETDDGLGGKRKAGRIGVTFGGASAPEAVRTVSYSPTGAVARGWNEMVFVTEQTLGYIWRMVTLRDKPDQLGGIPRIAEMSGKVTSDGFVSALSFIAFISLSIGLANLLPIPILDGGHLCFYAAEAIRGKPLSDRAMDYAFRFGAAVLLTMFAIAMYNDLGIIGRWIGLG
jgi:regulator of sigma E protease